MRNPYRYCEKLSSSYIKVTDEKISQSFKFKADAVVDFDSSGNIIGIEILNGKQLNEHIKEIKKNPA